MSAWAESGIPSVLKSILAVGARANTIITVHVILGAQLRFAFCF